MANVVKILIEGEDRSGAAMRGVVKEMKSIGTAVSQTGAVVSELAGAQFGALINSLGSGISFARGLVKDLGESRSAMVALGAAATATGVAISGAIYDLFNERATKTREEQLDFLGIVQEAQMATLASKDAEYAAYVRINQKIDEQGQKLMRMKNISVQQFIQGADALNEQREANRVRYVKTADDEIAKVRGDADAKFERAQELIHANEMRRKDEQFKKYIENLDAEIESEIETKKLIKKIVDEEADAYEKNFQDEKMRRSQMLANVVNYTGGVASALGSLAANLDSSNKKQFKLAKALRYGEAVMSTASGIARCYADYPLWLAIPMSVIVAAAGAAQIAAIAGQKGPAGQAHSGMDYVPSEGSYTLQRGEMVLDPGTSNAVRNAAVSGGGQMVSVTVNLDSYPLFKAMDRASRDGRLVLSSKAIV